MDHKLITTQLNETKGLKTLQDFMRWGASCFMQAELSFSHGMESAIDEAVYLSLRAVYLPVDTPEIYWQGRLTPIEKKRVINFFTQRIVDRKPAAYITQEGWFAGLLFYIDERVLVPRSPISELIENQFSPWVDPYTISSILDLCTGSACIGIACAYAFPDAEVDVVDISQDALDVAHINIQKHAMDERVVAIQSDLFSNLDGKIYDLIVTNPPYVDQEDINALTQEFKHEPQLGLASGNDGLDATRTILQYAAQHLSRDGVLIVEVGNSQYALSEAFPQIPFYWLEFQKGGEGVFVLTAQQLEEYTTHLV
jgi:ribosomal protein L3 glutamine methyltransferase